MTGQAVILNAMPYSLSRWEGRGAEGPSSRASAGKHSQPDSSWCLAVLCTGRPGRRTVLLVAVTSGLFSGVSRGDVAGGQFLGDSATETSLSL